MYNRCWSGWQTTYESPRIRGELSLRQRPCLLVGGCPETRAPGRSAKPRPGRTKAIERAAAALKKLPELTPEIDVQIEVAHRMGGEEFSESYSYLIRLDQQGVEISSSGSQCGPAVGSDSFNLESLKWYANGQVEQKGNRDTWLERLSYALARNYTLNVTDRSGDKTYGRDLT